MSFPDKITIEPYSENWPRVFNELKTVYETFLGNRILNVHHVGSTSVPGLAAKPIIDADIEIGEHSDYSFVKEKLEQLGYECVGDLGIKDRFAFRQLSELAPQDGTNRTWQKHHLYVCHKDITALRNHLMFRNYLRENPEKAKAYERLKKQLAEQHAYDIDAYVEEKTAFITAALREKGFDLSVLDSITQQNKAKKQ